MKSMLLVCAVLLVSTLTTIHCQEEAVPTTTTTPQPPAASEESAKAPETTTTTEALTTTAGPESNSTSAKEDDKPEEKPEEKLKENESQETGAPQPKILFVQQHVRDSATGIIYTRQVPFIPSNYLRPLPYQPHGQQQPEQQPNPSEEQPTRYDPLGQFSGAQKKRQFYQDMLVSQLAKFEGEIVPLIEREQNVTEKNDLEEVLGAVGELKRVLEAHQIFNITDIMNNWKQGRLAQEEQGQGGAESAPGPQGPPPPQYRPRGPLPASPQQVQLRTLILVPQNRVLGPPQMPQQPYDIPYNPMGRPSTIPVIHIHQRRGTYQPAATGSNQQQQPPQADGGQFEPEAAPSEEYSNGNEIFGY